MGAIAHPGHFSMKGESSSMGDKQQAATPVAASRAAWQKPSLQRVGNVGNVFLGGGGKLSVTADDSGDSRKPKGLG